MKQPQPSPRLSVSARVPKTEPTTALTVKQTAALTAEPLPAVSPAWAKARELAQQAIHHAASGRHYMILAGLELLRLERAHPELRGKHNAARENQKSTGCAFLNWGEVVEREVGISRATASRWMTLTAEALKAQGVPALMFTDPPAAALARLPEWAEERQREEVTARRAAAQQREAAKRETRSQPLYTPLAQAKDRYYALRTAERDEFARIFEHDLRPRLKKLEGRRKTNKTKPEKKS